VLFLPNRINRFVGLRILVSAISEYKRDSQQMGNIVNGLGSVFLTGFAVNDGSTNLGGSRRWFVSTNRERLQILYHSE
jgi:hypothetical protein